MTLNSIKMNRNPFSFCGVMVTKLLSLLKSHLDLFFLSTFQKVGVIEIATSTQENIMSLNIIGLDSYVQDRGFSYLR